MQKFIITACLILLSINFIETKQSRSISPGLAVGGNQPKTIHIEVFYDLLCGYSKRNFNLMMRIINDLNLKENSQFKFTIYTFPLPKFRNSHLLNTVLNLFLTKFGKDGALKYLDVVFSNQQRFWDSRTRNMTQIDIENLLADILVSTSLFPGLVKDEVIASATENIYRGMASRDWRLGVKRGVTGTPSIYVDGEKNEAANGFDLNAWIKFVNDRLAPENNV